MRNKVLVVLSALVVLALMVACAAPAAPAPAADEGAAAAEATEAPAEETAADAAAEAPADGEELNFTTVVKIAGINWFNRMEEGVVAWGEENGVNANLVGPAEADAAQQIPIIEDLIA
ncbi:MAG: hypothetical protein KDD83_08050, partial [Caldilineaceae bacterium]|nr:hypothetical protein [Caldilineaceae bacterium]